MQPNEITEVLNRPISQELLARDVTRLAYEGPKTGARPDISRPAAPTNRQVGAFCDPLYLFVDPDGSAEDRL